MKKSFILFLFTLLLKNLSAQESFGNCVKNIFNPTDTAIKLRTDPIKAMKNCVMEKQIPNFFATSLSGDSVQMNKLKGKIVVINFWFIDCHPCIAEMPALNQLVDEYKNKDVVFLAITWETAKRIENDFLSKYKLDFIIIPDTRKVISELIGPSPYPTTYIINQQGVVKAAWFGGRTDELAIKEYYENAKPVIDELLKAH